MVQQEVATAVNSRLQPGRAQAGRVWVWLLVAIVLPLLVVAVTAPTFTGRYLSFVSSGARLDAPYAGEASARLAGTAQPLPPAQTAHEAGIDPEALRLAADYAKSHGSTALLVARRGHRVYEWYAPDYSADSLVAVAEFQRLLTVLAAGVAFGEAKFGRLDEPAANYLPEWRDNERASIALRHLLTDTSGLAPVPPSVAPWSAAVRERLATDRSAALLARPLRQAPGRVHLESSVDLALVGIALARAAREDPAAYLSRALWAPLGAADATLQLDRSGGAPHLDCCLQARMGDWLRVAMLLAQDGLYDGAQIVPAYWLQQIRSPATVGSKRGMIVRWDGEYAARDTLRVEAERNQRMWIVPSLQIAIVRFGGAAGTTWDDAIIPDSIVRGTRDFAPRVAPRRPVVDPSQFAPGH
jgi:CubicO group peptidase (beta-lactamase class C family)